MRLRARANLDALRVLTGGTGYPAVRRVCLNAFSNSMLCLIASTS